MKLIRNLGIGVVLLVVVLIAGAIVYIPSLVKSGTETVSTDTMGTQTTVGSADVSFTKGEVAINQYTVKNPEGYSTPNFISIGQIKVGASVADLRKDPVEVGEILIDRPELTVEQSSIGTNLQQIMDNVMKKPSSRWKIQKLVVKGGKVNFKLPLLGKDVTVDSPDIELNNLTNKDGGPAMMGDLIKQVLQQMVAGTAGKGGLPTDFQAQLTKIADLGSVTQGAQQAVDQAKGAVEDAANKAKGAIDSLFGGKK